MLFFNKYGYFSFSNYYINLLIYINNLGVALQCLGRHDQALGAFSEGLAREPNSERLLSGLIEACEKSPLAGKLRPTFEQLRTMGLGQSPFVVISVSVNNLYVYKGN